MTQVTLTVPLQTTMSTKPITTPKVTPVKANPVGMKMIRFATKPISRSTMSISANTKTVTSV